jgi:hypothetical protein
MAIMAFVSQNEKDFHACPSMPHAVAADGTHAVAADGSHAVAGDGSHAVAGDGSHAVAADRRACAAAAARRAWRKGPGPQRTAPRFPHAGSEKNYKVPATLPVSPRVLKRVFPFPALNAQLTLFRVLVAVFEVCGNGDDGIC